MPVHLVFIESTGKPLSRDASAGSVVAVTLSLAGSVSAANEQAFGHEVELRNYGRLKLIERGTAHVLDGKNQRLESIVLALFDYGAFQDHKAVAQLLRHVIAGRYGRH